MSGGPGEHTLPYNTEVGTHPLSGMAKPEGNPDAVRSIGNTYGRIGGELENVSKRLERAVGDAVGGAWIGKAHSSCDHAVGQYAQKYATLAGYANEAGGALVECANAWQAALEDYKRAETKAGNALEEEANHRREAEQRAQQHDASGDAAQARIERSSAETWESPARDTAGRVAHEAINAFEQATQKACATLDGLANPLSSVLTTVGSGGGVALNAAEQWNLMYARNMMRHDLPLSHARGKPTFVPDKTARGKYLAKARMFKAGGYVLSAGVAAYGQWAMDQRKHPNMDTEERVGRAGGSAISEGLGSAAIGAGAGYVAGAATGAAVGSVVPGVGTVVGLAVGAGVGYLASKGIDKIDDAFVNAAGNVTDATVDAVGNAADATADWVSDKWHDWTPW